MWLEAKIFLLLNSKHYNSAVRGRLAAGLPVPEGSRNQRGDGQTDLPLKTVGDSKFSFGLEITRSKSLVRDTTTREKK